MKKLRLSYLRWAVLALLFCFVLFASVLSEVGEWYAIFIYPTISIILSALSSLVNFSLDEWGVVLIVLTLVMAPFYLRFRKHKSWLGVLGHEAELLLWVYVWFYWAWGMNYDRFSFFRRAEVAPAVYNEAQFHKFLKMYTDELNETFRECQQLGWVESPDLFRPMVEVDVLGSFSSTDSSSVIHQLTPISRSYVQHEIKSIFRKVPSRYGLCKPQNYQRPKRSSFNELYSNVGVLGFMGPFFAESHINLELTVLEYPFTYAHELSHLLGVSNEAEANLWAYVVCTQSQHPFIKLSGYVGLLSYVRSNVYGLLPSSEVDKWEASVAPEILASFYRVHAYWALRYNPVLGNIQSSMYEFYLKRNKISSGQKNYAQVVGMLLSLPKFTVQLD